MIQKFDPFVENAYPTTDPRIMSETEWHLRVKFGVIFTLKRHFENDPNVYVTGDMLVFSKPNDKRWHLCPDVFAVRGVRKDGERPNYLIWEEGKAPEMVIEITSASTKKNDLGNKFERYRDEWKVKEYFLFDPYEDYLDPPMQGYRLVAGEYVRIREKDGRLPSRVLGLHLERSASELRFWDPARSGWILTDRELAQAEHRQVDEQRRQVDEQRRQVDEQRVRAEAAEAELARLRALLNARNNGTRNGHK